MLAQVFPCSNEMNIIYVRLAFGADNHVANCGRSRNTRGTQLSQKRSPTRLPTNYPHDWHLEQRCPHWLEQGHLIGIGLTTCIVSGGAKSFHAKRRKLTGQALCPLAQVTTVDRPLV
jgi:hypothetical protein